MPELKFLADMNISPLTVAALRIKGFEIARVSEVLDAKSTDACILKFARDDNRIIITQDLDFSMLMAINGYERPSLISLRLNNPTHESVTDHILKILGCLSAELGQGITVVADEFTIRYRSLPISK